jgi:hypothetical protein
MYPLGRASVGEFGGALRPSADLALMEEHGSFCGTVPREPPRLERSCITAGAKPRWVPLPPWHFSGDAIGLDFRGDPDTTASVLPTASIYFHGWRELPELCSSMKPAPWRSR